MTDLTAKEMALHAMAIAFSSGAPSDFDEEQIAVAAALGLDVCYSYAVKGLVLPTMERLDISLIVEMARRMSILPQEGK